MIRVSVEFETSLMLNCFGKRGHFYLVIEAVLSLIIIPSRKSISISTETKVFGIRSKDFAGKLRLFSL